ncbi:hypothetical protein PC9H_002586 [Pleurotus ostreatus]|uniref:TPR-like protein n=3 Tax=Pleurotus TaxID=5320 RepID=A0A067N4C8_PLEO1|nr:uncharacterized protein PC9H_002586 [Pleurotus ostreatus]KAF7416321.1 hypothetical protein PC9H_002586 [Pleurotus ostreatus]KAG9225420.1 hypothetical protein CCMSSC00406_0002923 [Pleurotus cornucopiae]KDQ22843.1 hypothetical protein PLEOSDRAFT_174998 [Pleurotus ostreatus PC15]
MASNGKDKHYWTQLRSALTAGQWNTQHPSRTPNGIALTWKELFRKFNKHCRGFEDVCEVASKTRLLGLFLVANSKDEDQDDPLSPGRELLIGDECILSEERVAEGQEAFDELKKLEASNFDTLNFALAYYAYALGRPEECISQLSKVPDVSHVQNHIPSIPASLRSNSLSLQVPSTVGTSLSSGSGSVMSAASTVSIDEIKDGRAWAMTETIRSICLQGMSYEKVSDSSSMVPLKSYGGALPLLSLFESELAALASMAPLTTTATGKLDFKHFSHFRELWRWIERLLWRAIALCATSSNLQMLDSTRVDSIWVWLKHYMACSTYWPPSFRTQHRSVILSLHLRSLVILYTSPSQIASSADSYKSPQWLQVARSVVAECQSVLSVCTQFPRAGERNAKVEDFVDLCVAVWEASGAMGEHSGWVIDVLWWATRLTFNSPRIFRHMTRLFYVSGDTSLAKRTLKLYIQVVGKAYQTLTSDGGNPDSVPDEMPKEVLSGEPEVDTDRNWVETLCQGARMLCKSAASVKEGFMDDLNDAGETIEKAKTRLNKSEADLVAAVQLAEGIWRGVLALKSNDPYARPGNLALCHECLLESLATRPTPSAAYHLALSFARPGPTQDIEQAITHVAQAMEGDPKEVRYWHLMGLLLSGAEKWQAALEILDSGADIGEAAHGDDAGDDDEVTETVNADVDTLTPNPLRTPNGFGGASMHSVVDTKRNGPQSTRSPSLHPSYFSGSGSDGVDLDIPSLSLLPNSTGTIPPSSSLLGPMPDHPKPSTQEQFEFSLQLRMSQVAMIEYVEGAEAADPKWMDVFAWVAEKRGIVAQQPRTSLDGGRPPQPLLSSQARPNNEGNGENNGGNISLTSVPPPIPINILPATPDAHYDRFISDNRTSSDTEMPDTVEAGDEEGSHPHHHHHHLPSLHVSKRSQSSERDSSKASKRVQKFVKSGVHKGQATITTISKKIGNGVVRNGPLRRSTSTPDFHAALRPSSYQASSIHSRKRLSSIIHSHDSHSFTESPPPPPPPPLPSNSEQTRKLNSRTKKDNRLLSDLWLMSAATFRRLGKIEQAKGSIQEAEVRDEDNPNVWVQLGLYYTALGHTRHAIDAFHKAMFIDPDDISASVHLCRLYLGAPDMASVSHFKRRPPLPDHVDLAAGILSDLTKGAGWDVPEAWYYLAKAYGLQGRKEGERESLERALRLAEGRAIRDVGSALGWCL